MAAAPIFSAAARAAAVAGLGCSFALPMAVFSATGQALESAGWAGVTQLAECLLPKQNVAGSNPVSRSKRPLGAGLGSQPRATGQDGAPVHLTQRERGAVLQVDAGDARHQVVEHFPDNGIAHLSQLLNRHSGAAR